MKRSLIVLALIAVIVAISCSVSPADKKSSLAVPSWLVGSWEGSGSSINATSSNIIIKAGSASFDLGAIKGNLKMTESSSANVYYVGMADKSSGYQFTKKSNSEISFAIVTYGISTEYIMTKR